MNQLCHPNVIEAATKNTTIAKHLNSSITGISEFKLDSSILSSKVDFWDMMTIPLE